MLASTKPGVIHFPATSMSRAPRGIGVLTLGMMARVSLGHSGRPLAVGKPMILAFASINLAAFCRVFGVWLMPAHTMRFSTHPAPQPTLQNSKPPTRRVISPAAGVAACGTTASFMPPTTLRSSTTMPSSSSSLARPMWMTFRQKKSANTEAR